MKNTFFNWSKLLEGYNAYIIIKIRRKFAKNYFLHSQLPIDLSVCLKQFKYYVGEKEKKFQLKKCDLISLNTHVDMHINAFGSNQENNSLLNKHLKEKKYLMLKFYLHTRFSHSSTSITRYYFIKTFNNHVRPHPIINADLFTSGYTVEDELGRQAN
ncbi:hypothetical protein BpHYR1_036503 [Brachionus plicatilis]|uniref:Uncharacterized protein n=1 Tax=Brachionus plicatilis TaxID=10195 RepID=A0A3M7RP42_BRAPC|nr:hypothetical protein BpHYR1_036503 [Brachionus plicatilis]